ncbi:LytR/AlgR family response regulator transcription factor [Clostridium sp.]|uniref:LytR/AlgR family response regulator transcription factor n=1 Tax=Clostridium sp. TaxID=1506 RepID=UPI003F301B81
MIRIAICEDQIKQQELLKKYLQQILIDYTNSYEILIYKSGEELINNYPQNVDIFLLDIQMYNINGMDVARKIREIDENKVEIIFTTSLVEYIQEGYEVRAYRYLLKPIKYDDLEKHMISCIKEIEKRDKYLIINEKNDIKKIKHSEITYIEIQKKNMTIHTVKGDYLIKNTMDKIEREIDNVNFYRCHKSFLVNLEYVESIKQYVAILESGEEVLISRHRFKETKNQFYKFIGDKL